MARTGCPRKTRSSVGGLGLTPELAPRWLGGEVRASISGSPAQAVLDGVQVDGVQVDGVQAIGRLHPCLASAPSMICYLIIEQSVVLRTRIVIVQVLIATEELR